MTWSTLSPPDRVAPGASRLGVSARFSDPDALAASIHNCHATVQPTARGYFRAQVTLGRLPDLHLALASETLARRAILSFPPDRMFFRIVAHHDSPKLRDTVPDEPGTIAASPGLGMVHDITAGPAISRSLSMPIPLLLARAEALFDGQPAFMFGQAARLRPPAAAMARLVHLHEDMVARLSVATEATIRPSHQAAMNDELWNTLLATLAAAMPAGTRPSAVRRQRIVRRAAEFINANEHRPIALSELCGVAGCSAKTLETVFQSALGETPSRYLRRWRMWRAHEVLRDADPSATTVSEIAVRYGFWELGRFAVAYRRLFDEAPSQTLRRPPRGVELRPLPLLTNSA